MNRSRVETAALYLTVAAGVAAIFVLLFGDNLIPRMFASSPPVEVQPKAIFLPEPSTENAEEFNQAGNFVETTPQGLIDKVCAAKAFAITFAAKRGDAPRFKRQAGTMLVPIQGCLAESGTFDTALEGNGWVHEPGRVSGDRIEFRFTYRDEAGMPICRVAAQLVRDGLAKGNITCNESKDVLDVRRVTVEFQ